MRSNVGFKLAGAGLVALFAMVMAAGVSWGFGGVGIGVGGGHGAGIGVAGGHGMGHGISINRGDSDADFLQERASLEMGMGPRRPDRGIDGALRWDKEHRGWWSFLMRVNRRPAAGSEVGGRKTGRKGQEGKEFGALSKGG